MAGNLTRWPRAETDLDEIWLFIASDNIAAADRLLDRIGNVFQMLAENPLAGPPAARVGYEHSELSGRALLRSISNGVEIVRVLNGARDIARENLD
ncbi:type II toxin-antitoxin system RelE/ParE family toxin [Bradyrhizobium macuxiense]|uniref:type II toxin-antitoxin system RelE/ParE family toxin n=1 Tax=Bradyrhizobium macuxiense TaxID=1755647 RepID=UPI0011BF8685|nr:type II toxin-antitoxin system RelE/ParE family toxin [Bradyrhizobium macuxiense]